MYQRTEYEMTQEDLNELLDSMKPEPMIMLQCGTPPSLQERANRAWAKLGEKMGFESMTVKPTGRGDRFFTAIPIETQEDQQKQREIDTLTHEIADRQNCKT